MTSESAGHIILIPIQPVGSENNDNVINALLPSFSALQAQQFSLPNPACRIHTWPGIYLSQSESPQWLPYSQILGQLFGPEV